MAAALQEKADDLTRSNKELEHFAYVASHDLQEPLRMVASYTQLLQRRYQGKLDDDADQFIGYAVDGAKRMQGLLQDLLHYSRVSSGGKPFSRVDSGLALATACANLRTAIDESGAQINQSALPTVWADDVQLVQVFQNLLGNAIRYRGDDPPVVEISAVQHSDHCEFSIGDKGIGVAPEYSDKIFVIFQRLHTLDVYEGTGVGLAIVKKIIDRHGGRIWVESKEGQGATFKFTLSTHSA